MRSCCRAAAAAAAADRNRFDRSSSEKEEQPASAHSNKRIAKKISTGEITWDAIDDDEGAVGDAESGGDLTGEVDVAGGVDQVDEEGLGVLLAGLLHKLKILFIHLEVQGDGTADIYNNS